MTFPITLHDRLTSWAFWFGVLSGLVLQIAFAWWMNRRRRRRGPRAC